MMKKITCCLLLFVSILSFSQQKDTTVILPGSTILETKKLSDYRAAYEFISYKDGKEKIIGRLEDEFTVQGNSRSGTGLRVCKISFGENRILDSGLCLLKGFRPVYHRSVQTGKTISLDFRKELIKGQVVFHTGNGDSTAGVNYKSPYELFDSFFEDMIAKAVPFRTGFVFLFPEYIYERGGFVWSAAKAEGRLQIPQQQGGTVPAWKVIFYERDTNGETIRTTTYIIGERKREIITREYKTKNGTILMRRSDR